MLNVMMSRLLVELFKHTIRFNVPGYHDDDSLPKAANRLVQSFHAFVAIKANLEGPHEPLMGSVIAFSSSQSQRR